MASKGVQELTRKRLGSVSGMTRNYLHVCSGCTSGSVSEVSRARCHLILRLFDGGTGLLELGDELRVVKDAARDLRAEDGGRQREGSSAPLSQ